MIPAFSYGQSSVLETVCAESRSTYGVTGLPNSDFVWVVEDGVIVEGEGEDTIMVQWGYKPGTFMIEVVEVAIGGCIGVPVMAEVTTQAPEVDLGYDFYEICDGDSMIFDATGNYVGASSYLWNDGSINSYYIADTTEDVWVVVTDGLGCTRKDSLDFVSHELPVVYLGEDTIFCDVENELLVDAGDDFVSYEWKTASDEYFGNPLYLYKEDLAIIDTISVVVTDINTCQAYDTLLVFACDASLLFDDMINTFTPDGDGVNDTWAILKDGGMAYFPDAVLEVFDRWGRLVYRTENVLTEPWDGTSKGREMPMDAYFFVLELNFNNFEAITGAVNLIR